MVPLLNTGFGTGFLKKYDDFLKNGSGFTFQERTGPNLKKTDSDPFTLLTSSELNLVRSSSLKIFSEVT